jgi:hypothetical protein
VTQEDREMTRERDGDQVRGEVSPGGTREAVGRPESPLRRWWGRWHRDNAGPQPGNERWCCASSGGSPWGCFPGSWGVELYRLEKWRDAALVGMEEALKARNGDPLKAELDNAMKRLGE